MAHTVLCTVYALYTVRKFGFHAKIQVILVFIPYTVQVLAELMYTVQSGLVHCASINSLKISHLEYWNSVVFNTPPSQSVSQSKHYASGYF